MVGCVKQKALTARPARDLYVSALFEGRRVFVERSCSEWWILSALHGLIHPDQVLEPYDVTLKDTGPRGAAGVVAPRPGRAGRAGGASPR